MKAKHILDYCDLCEHQMVRCGTCNNNCCNAMYGEVNGEQCPDCPEAYAIQDLYEKNPTAPELKEKLEGIK